MKISDFFTELSYGELSNLSLSNSGSGEIVEAKHAQVIQYLNTALSALYGRFVLKRKSLVIELVEDLYRYELKSENAVSSGNADPYIIDTEENPFIDDLLRILEIKDEDDQTVPLNDADNVYSCFTPELLVLTTSALLETETLTVLYQAEHVEMAKSGDGYLDQEIILPHYLNNALRKRVAAEVFSHMNGQENILKSQEYLAAYEADCLVIENRDLANQTAHTSHTKLEGRGFV